MKNETFVSVILIADNQSEYLIPYLSQLCPYLEERYSDYEVVIIDQRSTDSTVQKLSGVLKTFLSIRHIRLSQKVAGDIALAAGIENAIGDFVVNLNIETDKVELVEKLVESGKSGSDIVICTSEKVTSLAYRVLRKISGGMLNSIGYTLPENSTGSFCLSRRAVNAVTESGHFYCKLYVRMANTGYSMLALPSDDFIRGVKVKSIQGGVRETLHHMVFNSTKPLRWVSVLGMAGSLATLVFSFYSLIVHFVKDEVAPGWTTTILFMSFLFLLMFIMFSFFAEYLGRLLEDTDKHREYYVSYEKTSSVMLDENRSNIHFSSESPDQNLSQTGRDR